MAFDLGVEKGKMIGNEQLLRAILDDEDDL